jgi:hypothetical protein
VGLLTIPPKEKIMKKRMYVEVIEPKTITLTKDQKQWVLTFVERDLSNDNRQERTFWIDVKINPPRDKFIIIRYEVSQSKKGDYYNFIAFEDPGQFFGKNKNEGGVK